jgi:hypothetical protein
MNAERQVAARRRRTRAEVQQLVSEFASSGMRQNEFCRSRGLSLSTLARHLKKRRWKKKRKSTRADCKLLGVELATGKPAAASEASCGLAVVLSGGRKIEVAHNFDVQTFERLVNVLEQV